MKARPILFSTPVIKALLSGRKTQTRRIMKSQPQPSGGHGLSPVAPYQNPYGDWTWGLAATGHGSGGNLFSCPYGRPGDLLWVRETIEKAKEYGGIGYPADGTWFPDETWEWKRDTIPSIHMPRQWSRITLEITNVRVQRVQETDYWDSFAEGISLTECGGESIHPCDDYRKIWESIHGVNSWVKNSWVWALTFKVHQKNVDKFISERSAA